MPNEVRDDPARLALAGGMAFLAGATDVYGLSRLHDLYVSFMSGNTTSLGKAIGEGDFARAATAAGLIGLFVAGAAVGAVLAEFDRETAQRRRDWVGHVAVGVGRPASNSGDPANRASDGCAQLRH